MDRCQIKQTQIHLYLGLTYFYVICSQWWNLGWLFSGKLEEEERKLSTIISSILMVVLKCNFPVWYNHYFASRHIFSTFHFSLICPPSSARDITPHFMFDHNLVWTPLHWRLPGVTDAQPSASILHCRLQPPSHLPSTWRGIMETQPEMRERYWGSKPGMIEIMGITTRDDRILGNTARDDRDIRDHSQGL